MHRWKLPIDPKTKRERKNSTMQIAEAVAETRRKIQEQQQGDNAYEDARREQSGETT
jgi:hypothetical protein